MNDKAHTQKWRTIAERMETITTYHVFADGFDAFYLTLKEATNCYRDLKLKGYRNRRINKDTSTVEGAEVTEMCIRSAGDFPY